jgi:dehydrogenase/reductase SDR family protein 12
VIRLERTFRVAKPIAHCFYYLSDFRHVPQWDRAVISAQKISTSPTGIGTEFDLLCRIGPLKRSVTYVVQSYEAPTRCALTGTCDLFDVADTLTFTDCGDHTEINYQAEFVFKGAWLRMESRLQPRMEALADATQAGIEGALTTATVTPTISAENQRADRHLPTALARFSRYGYTRGRRSWQPMTTPLDGVHIVLTGASNGLGLATAQALAVAGADLTLVVRDPAAPERVRNLLSQDDCRGNIQFELADLSLMSEVQDLSQRLLTAGRPIDVLINNAGALFNEFALTREGIEQSFALLLLSPWLLTRALHPLLAGHSAPARVVNVVSGGMYAEALILDRLEMAEADYRGTAAYARAKRGLTVMTQRWAEQWRHDNIVVNAMHPGWADTPGVQNALPGFRKLTRRILRSPEEGADTIIWLARAAEADQISGQLFLDREPRTQHLTARTRERASEVSGLETLLQERLAQALRRS